MNSDRGQRELPWLPFCTEPNAIHVGTDVAFAGLPRGSDGLLLRIDDQPPIFVQGTPFLRHGIISPKCAARHVVVGEQRDLT